MRSSGPFRPDLITTEITRAREEVNGYGFLELLRADPLTALVPVIAVPRPCCRVHRCSLDALRLADGRVNLLMIDVVMPECDGVAVGRNVLERWPDQRILYMSAHPAEVLVRHGLTTLNVPFLAKPYSRDEILAKVKKALEKPHPKKRILVVDDDPSVRSALGKMLTMAGYEVILAADGVAATRLWRERGADLVILDVFMPDKDGIETIIELRALRRGLPIIVMSGGGPQAINLLPEVKLLGAVATIEKPFDLQTIMKLVARAVTTTP